MSGPTTPTFSGTIASTYDEILGPVYFEPYAIETAKRVAVLKPRAVLETACGTGRVTNHLRQQLDSTASLFATDISADMMDIAKNKLLNLKNITWVEADALNLPFEDDSFDVVVCQFGAMFFMDKQKGFEEARRVLRNGGTFIFSTWDKLQENEIAYASRKILREFFDDNPPPAMGIAFSMTDKNEMAALLRSSEFIDIKLDSVGLMAEAESAEQLAIATVDGSIVRNFIIEKDPHAIPALRMKMAEAIREKCGDHPVRGKMQAIIVSAKKE